MSDNQASPALTVDPCVVCGKPAIAATSGDTRKCHVRLPHCGEHGCWTRVHRAIDALGGGSLASPPERPVDPWDDLIPETKRAAGECMAQALISVGAQPAVALTEAPLAATMAKVLSAFGEPGMTWRSEASAIVAALGPVAIPAGIGIDREALTWARRYINAETGFDKPMHVRAIAALDAIRAGQPGAVS